MVIDYNLVIEKISEEYRNKLKEENILEKYITNIYRQLEDKNIPHNEFIQLQELKEVKEKEYEIVRHIADGISIAREIVFELN